MPSPFAGKLLRKFPGEVAAGILSPVVVVYLHSLPDDDAVSAFVYLFTSERFCGGIWWVRRGGGFLGVGIGWLDGVEEFRD